MAEGHNPPRSDSSLGNLAPDEFVAQQRSGWSTISTRLLVVGGPRDVAGEGHLRMANVNANPPRLLGEAGIIVPPSVEIRPPPAAGQESTPDSLREATRLPVAKAPTFHLVHDSS